MMKKVLVLVAILITLFCVQTEAKRFLMGEVNKEKSDVVNHAANVKPKHEHEKPITGSVETIEAKGENTISNTSADSNKSRDENNDSYENYGNP